MKTKLIVLAAAGSALLFSCTSDRNEEENLQPTPVSKVDVKEFKINNKSEETSKVGDSITIVNPPATTTASGEVFLPENPDPSEGGDPKDVPPRK